MKGAGYWKERAGQRVTEAERASAPYLRKIAARYREAARSIDRDIRKVLDAYRQDFTRAEAEAFLREEIPMAEYNRLKEILPEIQDERYRKELTMRLNAQSYRYRITRMQYIRQLILARLSEGADYEKRASSELYRETAKGICAPCLPSRKARASAFRRRCCRRKPLAGWKAHAGTGGIIRHPSGGTGGWWQRPRRLSWKAASSPDRVSGG